MDLKHGEHHCNWNEDEDYFLQISEKFASLVDITSQTERAAEQDSFSEHGLKAFGPQRYTWMTQSNR